MTGWQRYDLQLITTKLDLGHVTLREAKLFALRLGYRVKGQSKERFLRELWQRMNEGDPTTASAGATTGAKGQYETSKYL